MCENSDDELSDLDVESRTWNKLQNNMKQIGFREGAARGRDLSLQQGFNLGYTDGFQIGEYLGMIKGILSLQKELDVKLEKTVSDEDLKNVYLKVCTMCQMNERADGPSQEENYLEKLESLVEKQKSHNNDIITLLGFKLDVDKSRERESVQSGSNVSEIFFIQQPGTTTAQLKD